MDIDFSNLDLKNFRFVRYPPTKRPPIYYVKDLGVYVRPLPRRETPLEAAYKRTKAAIDYFKQLLTGDPLANMRLNIRFDPDAPVRNAPIFQKHFGYRGEKLVELLGIGADLKTLEFYGAIPKKRNKLRNQ